MIQDLNLVEEVDRKSVPTSFGFGQLLIERTVISVSKLLAWFPILSQPSTANFVYKTKIFKVNN